MKLFLYGISAAQWWARAATRGAESEAFGNEAFSDCAPTVRGVRYVRNVAPFLTEPYHFLVPTRSCERSVRDAQVHVSSYDFPQGSFIRVASGLYVSSPELCFVQMSAEKSFFAAVKHGYALCGRFLERSKDETGLGQRAPISSVADLSRYVQMCGGARGISSARSAVKHVRDGSASPRETDLAMRLLLPSCHGGFGLPDAVLNYRIDLSVRARAFSRGNYYVADLCWPHAKLAIEYDSDLHLTSDQLSHDAVKRAALEAEGYKVITVTRKQLNDPLEMLKVAKQAAHRLGRRIRPQSGRFEKEQRALFRLA
ncbi:MAG: DUF559 domain-containing protein [Eggerthellaceae bacterium]|nr:DUF559 domain-containing protein [Eggerthellaceae bacterium]